MKYFVYNDQRKGSCYHEFYKGKWDGETFWRENSIFLDDNVLYKIKGLEDALIETIPKYDPFGETEISAEEWKKIGKAILHKDREAQELYREADEWLTSVFAEYGCFTILGI